MEPLKICLAIDHLRPGGAQNILLHLAEGLTARGHTVTTLSFGPAEAYESRFADAGLPLTALNRSRFDLIRSVKGLRAHLAEHTPDILQTFLFKADIVSRIATCGAANRPVLVSSLQWGSGSHVWWFTPAYKLTAGSCDFTVPVSEDGRDLAISRLGVRADRVRVIPNAVDLSRLEPAPDRKALRAELGIPVDAFVVVSVGRLTPVKSFDVLIDGFAEFASRVPNALLMLVGDGELRDSLTRRAEALGNNMFLPGYKENGWQYAGAADVFVSASRSEGSSNSVLEAMAQGTPVIATDVPGNNEIVFDDRTGLLIPWKRPDALADALATFQKDPIMAGRLGAQGRELAREKHSVETMAADYESVYRELLDNR